MEEEVWAEISGQPGYLVSNFGRIKSIQRIEKSERYFNGLKVPERIMKMPILQGYPTINIRGRMYKVHRLVAKYFVNNADNKPDINHKDGNKSNNHHSNLEWVTHRENIQHAYDNGLITLRAGGKYKN